MDRIKVVDHTGGHLLAEGEFDRWVGSLSAGQEVIVERYPSWFIRIDVLEDSNYILTEVKNEKERVLIEKASGKLLNKIMVLMLHDRDLASIEDDDVEWSDFFGKDPWTILRWATIVGIFGTVFFAVFYGFYDLFFG